MKDKNNELEHTLFQLEEAVSNLQKLTSGFVQDVEWANKKITSKNSFTMDRRKQIRGTSMKTNVGIELTDEERLDLGQKYYKKNKAITRADLNVIVKNYIKSV